MNVPKSQVVDRYKNRRKMAWWSFWLILIIGTSLIAFGLSSDERANRMETMSFLITTIFGVWVSVVLAYFGACVATDRAEIRTAVTPIEGPQGMGAP